jgi:hypothetical protein
MKPSTSVASNLAGVKRWLILGLAVIGTLYIASLSVPRVLRALSAPVTEDSILNIAYSPDGKFKAVLFNENGGGGISPYCFDFISVVPAAVPNPAANQDAYRVYEAGCHTLGFKKSEDGQRMMVGAPLIHWSSNSVLEITFDPTMAASGINEFIFRGSGVKGQVQIVHHQFIENNP